MAGQIQSNETRSAPLGKNGIVASDHSLSLAMAIEGTLRLDRKVEVRRE